MKTFKTEIEWVMMPERPVRKHGPFEIQFGPLGRVPIIVFCEAKSGIKGGYEHYIREAVYDFEKEEFVDGNGIMGDEVFNDVAAWAYYDNLFNNVETTYLKLLDHTVIT